jgi:hypothetical protein
MQEQHTHHTHTHTHTQRMKVQGVRDECDDCGNCGECEYCLDEGKDMPYDADKWLFNDNDTATAMVVL